VAAAVHQQNEQVSSISTSIETVDRDSSAMEEAINAVHRMTDETNSAAGDLGSIADGLSQQSDHVARELKSFESDIRESTENRSQAG